jgi:hypothetical protein
MEEINARTRIVFGRRNSIRFALALGQTEPVKFRIYLIRIYNIVNTDIGCAPQCAVLAYRNYLIKTKVLFPFLSKKYYRP